MMGGATKITQQQDIHLAQRVLNLNVNREAKGKPNSVGIGGVLCEEKENILVAFSGQVGEMDSNEADINGNYRGSSYHLFALFERGKIP